MANRCRISVLTSFALIAFAANSVLCRLALGEGAIDAVSFSTIRLVSGAFTLVCISAFIRKTKPGAVAGDLVSAVVLFLYAVTFSLAYVTLSAGTGALILFSTVQGTMIIAALWSGERLKLLEWIGVATSLIGLIYLVFPGLSAPSPMGVVLMTIAGIAWGVYSLRGRRINTPVETTTGNFMRSVPFALILSLFIVQQAEISQMGIFLGITSGAVASGVWYVVWYAALRDLKVTHAAIVQLLVPVLAGFCGVVFLAEAVSLRLVLSAIGILGGITMVVLSPSVGTSPMQSFTK